MPMTTKLGKLMTYNEELPHRMLYDSSITWSYEVT